VKLGAFGPPLLEATIGPLKKIMIVIFQSSKLFIQSLGSNPWYNPCTWSHFSSGQFFIPIFSPLHQARIGPFFNSENHMEMCLLVLCIKQELVLLLGLSFFKWAMFCTVLRCPLHQARIGPSFGLVLFQVGNVLYSS
jgi:hypothetical protein